MKSGERPRAPWDKLQGVWLVEGNPGQQIYFRWDREYQISGDWPKGDEAGIWHIPAHRSELRLIPFTPEEEAKTWSLSFTTGSIMVWSREDQEIRFQKKE